MKYKIYLPRYTVAPSTDQESLVKQQQNGQVIPKGILASDFPRAWSYGLTGKGIKVAVLDTGIDASHIDLQDKIIKEKSINLTGEINDDNHGTHVAGTIAANGPNLKGGAYDAQLIDVQVLTKQGGTMGNVIKGILHATQSGAHIINMSLGAKELTNEEKQALVSAVSTAWNNGTLCIAAAGNEGKTFCSVDPYEFPAAIPGVQSIAACQVSDDLQTITPTLFSEENDTVGFAACGVSVYSSIRNNNYGYYQGTSMASPHVSAMAAILAQYIKQLYPTLKGPTFTSTLLSLLRLNVVCVSTCPITKSWVVNKNSYSSHLHSLYLNTSWIPNNIIPSNENSQNNEKLTCPNKNTVTKHQVTPLKTAVPCEYSMSVGYGFIKFIQNIPDRKNI